MKWDVSDFNERFNRWKNGESYWDLRNINLNNTVDIPSSVSQDYITSYVDDYFRNYDNGKDSQLVEYIKTIENPDSVGYDPETNTWNRVQMKGFDPNTYGYGLDYRYFDNSILNDDGSMNHDVMLNHVNKKLKYYEGAAKRNGVDKNKMSNDDYLLSIGAMYRGDAKDVYNAVAKYNILKPGEFKKEIYNKYKQQGLNERIRQSEKFFKNKEQKSFVKSYNLIEDLKNQNSFMPKFDNGKNKSGYYQFMENLADKKAQEWTTIPFLPLNPDIVLTQMLNDNTYNYRQWYNDLPFGATVNDFKGHFPDTYKTVYHPTFSNESMYSPNNNKYVPNTQYNPNNITGGRWDGNNYILSKDQIDSNWNINKTVDYLKQADPGVKVVLPKYDSGKTTFVRNNNNPVKFDKEGNLVDQVTGEKGTMLVPNVTIKPKRKSNYSSAFDGSLWNFVDVTNALSGGILNRTSAIQNLRAAYDAYKYLKGDPGVKLIIPQYNSGKNIHIKKENRGKFTAAANKHGMSVQAFARKVLNAPKGKYRSTLRKRANFAKNAAKWHK